MKHSLFLPLLLKETYHELDEYQFKIILDPKIFTNNHKSQVWIEDSDGKSVISSFRNWGSKLICSFILNKDVSDGVATIFIDLKTAENESKGLERLHFWVIKP